MTPTRVRWIAGLFALSALMSACAPLFSRYRYVSLENYGDAQVVDRGEVTPGERTSFVGELPIRYAVDRPAYTVVFELSRDAEFPEVELLVQPLGERTLEFARKREVEVPECVNYGQYGEFRWQYFITCESGFDELDKVIRFNVRDLEGNLLGEEAIPYEIKRDGFFYYIDAI